MPSLIDVLVQTAADAGCAEPTRLRHSLETAADKRQPLVDALVDANMVDEDQFFEKLATGLGIPYDPNGATDAPEGIHNRFPAKIALRHRVFPTQLSNTEATLLTYNPFDLGARQAVGQELRKRVHWQIATRHRILEALHQGYGVGAENFEELLEGREAGDEADDLKQETTVLDEADEPRALRLIAEALPHDGAQGEPWTCGDCGERLEAQFQQCWQCGARR